MKKLKCSHISGTACPFEATGETNEEVKGKLMEHGHESHDEMMHGMSDEDKAAMEAKMDASITEE